MLYSPQGEITQKHCESCGQPFVNECEKCGTKIMSIANLRVYFSTGQPIGFPKRPTHCRECGNEYPWVKNAPKAGVPKDFWTLLHPKVVEIAKARYESGHYADAVEAALKALNTTVKEVYKQKTGGERNGVDLMRSAFSPRNPIIRLGDLETETGRSIQQGYMDIFAGAISGIRNPKAHDNIEIDEARAVHHLYVASLLFSKLDETL